MPIADVFIQGGPKKTDCFWGLITLPSMGERHLICQKFQNSVEKKILSNLLVNILCLVCIILHYTWNYAEFDKNTLILPYF